MEEQSLILSEQFCSDIFTVSDDESFDSLVELKSVLQFYEDDEKLEYISSKRKELREKLAESVYKMAIPLESIENDLNGSLASYFKSLSLSQCNFVEYSNSLPEGKHKHNRKERILIVSTLEYGNCGKPYFCFAFLDEFVPLVQYIEWSILFLELNKLKAEFKKEKIVDPKIKLAQVNNEVVDVLKTSHDKIDQEILSQPKSIIDLLDVSEPEKQNLLEYLKNTYAGKRSKFIAVMILALKETKLIVPTYNTELFEALRIDFGNIGSDEGINKILRAASRKDEALLKLVTLQSEKLRNHIANMPKMVV